MEFSEKEKMALTFSYLAYTGFDMAGDDSVNATKIKIEMEKAIHDKESWPTLNCDWDIVWGPAVFALPGTVFDSAFMYVVQQKSNTDNYYVAIRGTNPVSIPNWVIWDFQAKEQKAWPFVEATCDFKPKVSESTYFGFNTLFSLRPPVGASVKIEGAKTTLLEFFNKVVAKENPNAKVCVTGHSLGGALAPTLCLWLTEIQQDNVFKDIEFSTVAFAGPTAGNRDFADYSDKKLAGKSMRIANHFDVVTHAWEYESMQELPCLYASDSELPITFPTPPTWLFLEHLKGKAQGRDYKQLKDAKVLEGKKYWPEPYLFGVRKPLALLYLGQAVYQHVWAYPELMGMKDEIPTDELFSSSIIPDVALSFTRSAVNRVL